MFSRASSSGDDIRNIFAYRADTANSRSNERSSERLLRGVYNRDAPGAVAHFDAAQFFARFDVDNGYVV
jgi:hypothetical protein